MNPLVNDLRLQIKQYEVQEQLVFEQHLQDLRYDRFINQYSNKSADKYTGNTFQSKNSGSFIVTEYFNEILY